MDIRVTIFRRLSAAACLFALSTAASAGPILVFSVSEGTQPSNVGTITLTQVNSTTVDVLVDLIDTSLPNPQYGFVNSGGPHTPFAFNLAGTEVGVSATFIQPAGGTYTFGLFSLNLGGGDATPYGTYGVAIDSTAGNGSTNAYFGDLEFNVIRTSGLSTTDFVSNGTGFFAADLTDGNGTGGGNTGSQVWKEGGSPPNQAPEPQTIALFGVGLLAIAATRRRQRV